MTRTKPDQVFLINILLWQTQSQDCSSYFLIIEQNFYQVFLIRLYCTVLYCGVHCTDVDGSEFL